MKRTVYRITALIFALAVSASLAADTQVSRQPPKPRSPNLLIFGLGASYWPDAHDLDPSGSPFSDQLGRFHTWGVQFEMAYQRRVSRLGNVDVLVGGDFGVFANENSQDVDAFLLPFGGTIDGTLSARGIYLTPSVRFVLAGGSRWRVAVGGGAGYYAADISQVLEDGFESAELFEESELGGYLSAGFDRRFSPKWPRWRLRVEEKIHFADFGSTDSYAPGAGDLGGPIHTLLIGAVYDR